MKLLTYADLAQRTGVSLSTLYQWRRRGKLPKPHFEEGNHILWTERTVEEWMRNEGIPGPDRA